MLRSMTLLIFCLLLSPLVSAEKNVTLGLSSKISSLDPRVSISQPDFLFHNNTHEKLFVVVGKGGLRMASKIKTVLAKKISRDKNQDYIIELKKGILFHDGIELDADDLIFTINSIKTVKPASESIIYVDTILAVEKLSSHTVRVKKSNDTDTSDLLAKLGRMLVMSKRTRFSKDDPLVVNTHYHNPGTGPYKLVSSQGDNAYQFERFEEYHDEKPSIARATIQYFEDPLDRLTALQSGEIDLVDKITPNDMQHLKKTGEYNFSVSTSTRVMYLFPDSGRKQTSFIRDKKTNQLLETNPFQDARVRQAISYAIDRDFLSEQTLGGAGDPTMQFVSKGTRDYNKNIKTDKYLPKKAKQLLASAGYPNGFKLTLHGPNNRYINDEMVLKAIGKMLTNVGIETTILAMPKKEFFRRARNNEFSLSFMGWASARGKNTLQDLIQKKPGSLKKSGSWNIGGYNNPVANELIKKITNTESLSEEYKLIRKAVNLVMLEKAIIPLYSEKAIWASRKGIAYSGNMYSFTFIKNIYIKN